MWPSSAVALTLPVLVSTQQIDCCRLPLGVILPGQRYVGDSVRNDLRLSDRHVCVRPRLLQPGHHVRLPGERYYTRWLPILSLPRSHETVSSFTIAT
jgi:hypothetical protein